ncbi:type I pullulanase [Mycoplasmatota bacterium WC44]
MNFKKIILSFLLVFFISIDVSANGNTLVVHYYRFDEEYEDWNLWIWPEEPESSVSLGPENGAYPFTSEDDFGVVATINLSETNLSNSTLAGIIVRTNNWDKDVALDRYFSLEPNKDGEIHIYLVQANENIYTDSFKVDISNKIFDADFIDSNTIQFTTTIKVATDKISILENGQEFEIKEVYDGGTTRRLDVSNPISLINDYQIVIDFGDGDVKTKDIGLSGLFNSDEFNDQFAYDGELGAIHTSEKTIFRLWAPISDKVFVNLYEYGHPSDLTDYQGNAGVDDYYSRYEMTSTEKGVWEVTVNGDLDKVYYTYEVTNDNSTYEVVDPYAKSTGVNGDRGMVICIDNKAPIGWENDIRPQNLDNYQDSILYELHVRDLTTNSSWYGPEEYRGKYKGFTVEGTEYNGISTGIEHLKELGVTTVHLLPVFDYAIVDETKLLDANYQDVNDGIFNWGYMPENFNTPEGSYSTDPYNGEVRVIEFREMVMALHNANIRVVMDVVYNHTAYSAESKWHKIFPEYYHRMVGDTFSNGSGTGNETASERYMMSKYIVDSVVYWANEYHIDGFRFDLMKLHDVDTMNKVASALHEIDETIIVYGEPWDAGGSALNAGIAASKDTLKKMPNTAIFNDATRDAIKGSVFDDKAIGFVQGSTFDNNKIMLGIVGGVDHGAIPKTDSFTLNPSQSINYVTAHDNLTLHDKLNLSTSELTSIEIANMVKQSNAIILTSQGVPFLHAGVDFMRTKPCVDGECDPTNTYDHNSYRSPDSTNQLDWELKDKNIDIYNYYKGLIALRSQHPAFRMNTTSEVNDHLAFITNEEGLISYIIKDNANNDEWKNILVIHNNSLKEHSINLFESDWNVVVDQDSAGTKTIKTISNEITIKPSETLVLHNDEDYDFDITNGFLNTQDTTPPIEPGNNTFLYIVIVSIIVVAGISLTVYRGILKR